MAPWVALHAPCSVVYMRSLWHCGGYDGSLPPVLCAPPAPPPHHALTGNSEGPVANIQHSNLQPAAAKGEGAPLLGFGNLAQVNNNNNNNKGHSLRRACLQPATNTQSSKPRPPTTNTKSKGKLQNKIKHGSPLCTTTNSKTGNFGHTSVTWSHFGNTWVTLITHWLHFGFLLFPRNTVFGGIISLQSDLGWHILKVAR